MSFVKINHKYGEFYVDATEIEMIYTNIQPAENKFIVMLSFYSRNYAELLFNNEKEVEECVQTLKKHKLFKKPSTEYVTLTKESA